MRLAACLGDKDLAERLLVLDLPHSAVRLQHCRMDQGVQDWICGKWMLTQVSRAVGPVADDYPEAGQLLCQGRALRAPVQHVPSQVRRAVAIGYVEHDMSQDVVYQWLINSACSSRASPQ